MFCCFSTHISTDLDKKCSKCDTDGNLICMGWPHHKQQFNPLRPNIDPKNLKVIIPSIHEQNDISLHLHIFFQLLSSVLNIFSIMSLDIQFNLLLNLQCGIDGEAAECNTSVLQISCGSVSF